VPPASPGRKPGRAYRSPQRSAQAQDTRRRIISAAAEQFASAGYPATTMHSVAAAAGVSVASIELAFGSKARLLKAAIDVAIAGDHDPVAVLDRDWATTARATTTVHDFLTAVGRTLRPAMTRSAGLVLAAYEAAGTDPALRELAEQLSTQRTATVRLDHRRHPRPRRPPRGNHPAPRDRPGMAAHRPGRLPPPDPLPRLEPRPLREMAHRHDHPGCSSTDPRRALAGQAGGGCLRQPAEAPDLRATTAIPGGRTDMQNEYRTTAELSPSVTRRLSGLRRCPEPLRRRHR